TAAALRKRLQEICNAVILGDQDEFAVTEDKKDPNYIKASWSHSAASHEGYDYGEYYAEVDLGNQIVYLIDHGKCIWSSSCVSGMMTKERYTPGGIYAVTYKQLHRVLTGYNPDGSVQYRSPVTYWMPFNKGIGFHDATWRGTFGGSIYVYGGSHGCINLPFSKAKLLYDLVYTGMPVILYY
ncbi:MAG: L,D-transpeptidase, partial [Eubacteriales bacterium]|nr:L,D-transpeptidase [Eubacteriales bacterium]